MVAGGSLAIASGSSQAQTVTADFGSRATTHGIPGNWIGAGAGGTIHSNYLPPLVKAGINYTRFHALIQTTYKTSTPNWSAIDAEVGAARAAGMHVILEMDFVPTWLLASPNPCAGSSRAAYTYPSSASRFAQLNAAYVTHMDHTFPGTVTDYEIWNEPDGGGLCTASNSSSSKLSAYLSIYAAVAPAIRSAARADGVSVRIGGPTLGSPGASARTWIPALLSDSRTAPYVDFVSYHHYPTGTTDVQHGMTWSGANGTPSLYAKTQASGSGFAGWYKMVADLVAQGSQPNAYNTPIYLDEFNSDWSFSADCCRNSAVYAPLWSALVLTDLLNTIYSGVHAVPAKVLYYAHSNPPFCIEGIINSSMNCQITSGTPEPYPQYYAYELFESSNALDLQDGGHMANSVSSSSSSLIVTAFYTNAGDTIMIVNPTGTAYSHVSAVAQATGYAAPHATSRLLNSQSPLTAVETAAVSPAASSGAQAYVSVPAYSVVAVTFQ